MDRRLCCHSFLLAILFVTVCVRAELVTLSVAVNEYGSVTNAEYVLGTNEVAELFQNATADSYDSFYLREILEMDGFVFQGPLALTADYNRLFLDGTTFVVGPAVLRLVVLQGRGKAEWTFRVGKQQFPPDKTVAVPKGGGARISIQSSTNLSNWISSPPGVYTNLADTYFTIKAERLENP